MKEDENEFEHERNDKEKERVFDNFMSLLKELKINWKLCYKDIRLIKKNTSI